MMKRASRAVLVPLLLVALLVPLSRCETRKQFHSRFSSSSSSSHHHHHHHQPQHQRSKQQQHQQTVVTDVVSREAYMRSIPLRLLDCLGHVSLVDCGKLYLLQNMESKEYRFANTGNLTYDIQQVLLPAYRAGDNKLFRDQLLALNTSDVNQRLARGLRLLLHERIVDLALLPGVSVRLTPSATDQLEFSVRKDVAVTDETEQGRDKAKKGLKTVLQLGVPLILLPSMLLAGVLPMILPVLKFATIFSSIVNHAALAAAIMYLARQHAAEQESKQTVYFNAGYN